MGSSGVGPEILAAEATTENRRGPAKWFMRSSEKWKWGYPHTQGKQAFLLQSLFPSATMFSYLGFNVVLLWARGELWGESVRSRPHQGWGQPSSGSAWKRTTRTHPERQTGSRGRNQCEPKHQGPPHKWCPSDLWNTSLKIKLGTERVALKCIHAHD